MTAKEYTDWWGKAEVVCLTRTQYMGIVADLAAAEEREEWWKNVAATADKHRKDLMAERDELKESLRESNMQCARLNDMVAGLTRTVDDAVQELSEANRQIDALAAEKRELEASIPAREREAYCEGWFGALKSCTDYHHADVMPQKHAALRYPGKEAT